MPSDNDSFNSSDLSDDLVDDEFSNDNVIPNQADAREESSVLMNCFNCL